MNFQQFQQSKRELSAVYDQSNILTGVGDLGCHKSNTETWFWVDGVEPMDLAGAVIQLGRLLK